MFSAAHHVHPLATHFDSVVCALHAAVQFGFDRGEVEQKCPVSALEHHAHAPGEDARHSSFVRWAQQYSVHHRGASANSTQYGPSVTLGGAHQLHEFIPQPVSWPQSALLLAAQSQCGLSILNSVAVQYGPSVTALLHQVHMGADAQTTAVLMLLQDEQFDGSAVQATG